MTTIQCVQKPAVIGVLLACCRPVIVVTGAAVAVVLMTIITMTLSDKYLLFSTLQSVRECMHLTCRCIE